MPPDCSYPVFTVLTPTYNRVDTLPRLYRSLCQQTYRNFEWLVIDDGSEDGTAHLVQGWSEASILNIHYRQQKNSRKHVAFNRGVAEARGELIAEIDDDDELLPNALEVLHKHWEAIPSSSRSNYVGVTGLCVDDYGNVVGKPFPASPFSSDYLEIRHRHRVTGEKWGFQRRDVLRQFPFPQPSNIMYVAEGIVWTRIARLYKTLYINIPLRIFHSDAPRGRLTTVAFPNIAASMFLAHKTILEEEFSWFAFAPRYFARSAVHYLRSGFHLRQGLGDSLQALRWPTRLLCLAGLPIAMLVYHLDRLRGSRAWSKLRTWWILRVKGLTR